MNEDLKNRLRNLKYLPPISQNSTCEAEMVKMLCLMEQIIQLHNIAHELQSVNVQYNFKPLIIKFLNLWRINMIDHLNDLERAGLFGEL